MSLRAAQPVCGTAAEVFSRSYCAQPTPGRKSSPACSVSTHFSLSSIVSCYSRISIDAVRSSAEVIAVQKGVIVLFMQFLAVIARRAPSSRDLLCCNIYSKDTFTKPLINKHF